MKSESYYGALGVDRHRLGKNDSKEHLLGAKSSTENSPAFSVDKKAEKGEGAAKRKGVCMTVATKFCTLFLHSFCTVLLILTPSFTGKSEPSSYKHQGAIPKRRKQAQEPAKQAEVSV